MTVRDPSAVVEVKLLGLPLAPYRSAAAHHDELFREFRLMLVRTPESPRGVPARLLELIEELDRDFGTFTAGTQAELEAALDRGDSSVDVVFAVPAAAREACIHFGQLLAEADEYCREGDLLTMAPPPDAIAFRNWYLNEFVAQIGGAPPTRYEE